MGEDQNSAQGESGARKRGQPDERIAIACCSVLPQLLMLLATCPQQPR